MVDALFKREVHHNSVLFLLSLRVQQEHEMLKPDFISSFLRKALRVEASTPIIILLVGAAHF